ncbi:unnamed protein product [Polarella glacialis]|uniref:Uncharacterized protein n=1 Tax=Polarella glacialis TaxID=89957 RepID=A0A813EUV2_POLGL|nr:unnamed protein product [Polarella glacialis]
MQFKLWRPGHINILESQARKCLIRRLRPRSRVVLLQDSKVCLGAGNKGRSSIAALNAVMSVECAWLIGRDITFLSIQSPTWALRADDPSRFVNAKAPRIPLPSWLLLLRQGKVQEASFMLDSVSDTPRALGRWTLFLAAAFSGDLRKSVVCGDYLRARML